MAKETGLPFGVVLSAAFDLAHQGQTDLRRGAVVGGAKHRWLQAIRAGRKHAARDERNARVEEYDQAIAAIERGDYAAAQELVVP